MVIAMLSTDFSWLPKLAHIAPILLYSLFIVAMVFAAEEQLVTAVAVAAAVAVFDVRLPELAHTVTTLWCSLSSGATLNIMAIELVSVFVTILTMLKLAHIVPTLSYSLSAKVTMAVELLPVVLTVPTRQHNRPATL